MCHLVNPPSCHDASTTRLLDDFQGCFIRSLLRRRRTPRHERHQRRMLSFTIQAPCPLSWDPIWGPSVDGIFYLCRKFEEAEKRGRWTLFQRLSASEMAARPRKVDGAHTRHSRRTWTRRGLRVEEMEYENVKASRG